MFGILVLADTTHLSRYVLKQSPWLTLWLERTSWVVVAYRHHQLTWEHVLGGWCLQTPTTCLNIYENRAHDWPNDLRTCHGVKLKRELYPRTCSTTWTSNCRRSSMMTKDHILEMNKTFLSQMKTLKCLKSWKCSTSGVYIPQKYESYSLASWRNVQFFFPNLFVLNSSKKGWKVGHTP